MNVDIALIAALRDSYANVQINAATSLGNIMDTKAFEPLVAMMADSNGTVRDAAAQGLGALGDDRAVQPLVTMVLKQEGEACLRGLQALARLKHPGAVSALRRYNQHLPDWKDWWKENKQSLLQ